jgi:hypothetical protein
MHHKVIAIQLAPESTWDLAGGFMHPPSEEFYDLFSNLVRHLFLYLKDSLALLSDAS